MVEVGRDLLRALVDALEAVDHVVGDQLARFHHAGLGREHDALAQLHLQAPRVLQQLPALRQLALQAIGRQPAVDDEGMLAAIAPGLAEVGHHQLLVDQPRVLVELPCPVHRIEAQRRDGVVHVGDAERAAVLRLVGGCGGRLGGARLGPGGRRGEQCCRGQGGQAMRGVQTDHGVSLWLSADALWLFVAHRAPRMRGSSRSRSASPKTLVAYTTAVRHSPGASASQGPWNM